jgi:hypothetical protein
MRFACNRNSPFGAFARRAFGLSSVTETRSGARGVPRRLDWPSDQSITNSGGWPGAAMVIGLVNSLIKSRG